MSDLDLIRQALALAKEYRRWRRRQDLNPTLAQSTRLDHWSRLAAEAGGVMYAPWSDLE